MPLLAEGFWKDPNVYDAAGVLGLIVGIVSIWLSWWLAKRDIEKRLLEASDLAAAAARDEVRRVARALLQGTVASTIRFLELSREAQRGRQWSRAVDQANLARVYLVRVLAQPGLDDASSAELRDVTGALLGYVAALGGQGRNGVGELAPDICRSLDEAILLLHRVDARLTSLRVD